MVPAYSRASRECSPSTLYLWKLLGSKEMKVSEDVTVFLQLFVSFYLHRAKQLSCGVYLQKQRFLVFASLPTVLGVMEWPSFLRLHHQGSTTSAFNCLSPTTLNTFAFSRRTFKVAQCGVWYCTSEGVDLLSDFLSCCSELVFPHGHCF